MSLAQLQRLLPLPNEELQQVLDHASTLSKQAAADHFNDLLGESPQSIEFISSFNSRRADPNPSPAASSQTPSEVPKHARKPPKKKAPLHQLPARQIQNDYATQGTVYKKGDGNDYMTSRPSISSTPQIQSPSTSQLSSPNRLPPSASGSLISDLKPKKSSNPPSAQNSRTSSPAPKSTSKPTKATITGGTAMHGASTALSALDSAIRLLEIQTNPINSKNSNNGKDPDAARRCNCIATRHPLLAAAPNCLNCGKVICVKEGLGPCTFCHTPLLSPSERISLLRELKDERGKEKMARDAEQHKRADISSTSKFRNPVAAPYSEPRSAGPTPGEAATGKSAGEIAAQRALEHRDRLLGYQAQNAKRTTVHDEAADWETPETGTSMWASPAERAKQLRNQTKVLRDMEARGRPEWEGRREVVSISIGGKGGKGAAKIVRKVERGEIPKMESSESEAEEVVEEVMGGEGAGSGGAFSRNPLLGGLIKPVWKGKGKEVEGEESHSAERRKKTWRRVQDEYEDNEALILDGGAGRGTLEG